jgi:hypothetical protein
VTKDELPELPSDEDEDMVAEICDMWRWLLDTRDSAMEYVATQTQTDLVAYHAALEQVRQINELLLAYGKESRGLSPIRTLYRENRDTTFMMADWGLQGILGRVHQRGPQGVVTGYQVLADFQQMISSDGMMWRFLQYIGCDDKRLFELVHSNAVVDMYCTKGPAKASVLLLAEVWSVSARTVERGIKAAFQRIALEERRTSGEVIDSVWTACVVVLASGGVVPGDRSNPLPVRVREEPPPQGEDDGTSETTPTRASRR